MKPELNIEKMTLKETQLEGEISVLDKDFCRIAVIRVFTNNMFNFARVELRKLVGVDDPKKYLETIIDYNRLSLIASEMVVRGEEENIIDVLYNDVNVLEIISPFIVTKHAKNDILVTGGIYPEPQKQVEEPEFDKIVVHYYKHKVEDFWKFVAIDKDGNEMENYTVPSVEDAGVVTFRFSNVGDKMIDQYGRTYEVIKLK